MTAVTAQLTGPVLRSSGRRRLARVLTVLALVLPIPIFAALGLSLPLPGTVERIAAKLVPFGDPEALDAQEQLGASGAIVLASGELSTNGGTATAPARELSPAGNRAERGKARGNLAAPAQVAPGEPNTERPATVPEKEHAAPTPTQPSSSPDAAPAAGPGSPPAEGGTGPGSGTTPQPVDTATATAAAAVEAITNTATSATSTAGETAKGATDTAKGAVGAVLPP
jgi:hypothetical protein